MKYIISFSLTQTTLLTTRDALVAQGITLRTQEFPYTVKLGFKERLDKEQLGNTEPFHVTNIQVHVINSDQIGIS